MSDSLRGQRKQCTQCVVTSCGVLDNISPSHIESWRSPYHVTLSHLRHNALDNNNTAVGATASCTGPPNPTLMSHDILWCLVNIYTKVIFSHYWPDLSACHPWSLWYSPGGPNCRMPFHCVPEAPGQGQVTSFLPGRQDPVLPIIMTEERLWVRSDMNHY